MDTRTAGKVRAAVLAVLVAGTLLLGCSDSGSDGGGDGDAAGSSEAPSTLLEPAAYEARMAEHPEALVVNVHVPYEGELEGTDTFIHFERIVGDEALPGDKDDEILLYCRTGRMSQVAAEALQADGYTNLYDLEGGMVAWEQSGRSLTQRSPAPD